jgi:hypothetical protein
MWKWLTKLWHIKPSACNVCPLTPQEKRDAWPGWRITKIVNSPPLRLGKVLELDRGHL